MDTDRHQDDAAQPTSIWDRQHFASDGNHSSTAGPVLRKSESAKRYTTAATLTSLPLGREFALLLHLNGG